MAQLFTLSMRAGIGNSYRYDQSEGWEDQYCEECGEPLGSATPEMRRLHSGLCRRCYEQQRQERKRLRFRRSEAAATSTWKTAASTAGFNCVLRMGRGPAIDFMRNHLGPEMLMQESEEGAIYFYSTLDGQLQHEGTYLAETKQLFYNRKRTNAGRDARRY